MLSLFKNRGVLFASVILLCQAVVYYGRTWTEVIIPTPPWSEFPASFDGWRRFEDSQMDDLTLEKLRPDDYLNRTYTKDNSARSAHLFIGYFKTRRSGFAPHSPEACLPGAGWKTVSATEVPVGATLPWKANRMLSERGGAKLIVLYWYLQGKDPVTTEVEAQFRSLPALLFHGRTDNAIVRIITPILDDDINGADRLALDFASSVGVLVQRHLP